MNTAAIILSAGKGKRMGSSVKKQYLMLDGYPVLYYAIAAFENSSVDGIVLVTGEEDIEYCRKNIVEKYGFNKVKAIVKGGAERYNSVHNGLIAVEEIKPAADIVLIHDGARAFVDIDTIERSIQCAAKERACVAAVRAKDTVKLSDDKGYICSTPPREYVWQIQTPQTFEYALIKKAYDTVLSGNHQGLTDDAMVLERFGDYPIKLVEASYNNIKITTEEDMAFGKAILSKAKTERFQAKF